MIYVTDAVLLVEIDTLTLRHTQFNKDENEAWLKCATDLVNKTKEITHVW